MTTLAILNGRIWTGDPARPWAEALACDGGTISAVGATTEIWELVSGGTRLIDATGKMVTPGFIDSHLHFLEGGMNLSSVQLRDARTPEEFVARIRDFAAAAPEGAWITGGDWDHENWGGELPRREWIDQVTPRNPVWVNRLDEHMSLANSLAHSAAGISRETSEVEGGAIVLDNAAAPT